MTWSPTATWSESASGLTVALAGTRSSYAWHNTLNEMGMVVISSTLTVGNIQATLDEHAEPCGDRRCPILV